MDASLKDYQNYYERTITGHPTGLKLVVGPTGLGKTRCINRVVLEALPADKKAIYIANRHQLLDEVANRFEGDYQFIKLKRDFEVVLDTLNLCAGKFYALLEDPNFKKIARRTKGVTLSKVRQAAQNLEELSELKDKLPKNLEKYSETEARVILGAFRKILREAKDIAGEKEWLLDHPVVQSLFPFIAFQRRSEVRILLVTVQKAFHGFFDGDRKVSLLNLNGYIIFMDEFDFLENELIKLACATPQIEALFKFVEFFYQEMRRHKLPLKSYPGITDKTREELEQITDLIDSLKAKRILYPAINQFSRPAGKANAAIFRTSHTITTIPLCLRQTHRAFEIIDRSELNEAEDSSFFEIQLLFNIVNQAARLILQVMKRLEQEDNDVYEEIKRQCFEDTRFERLLDEINFPAKIARNSLTQEGVLFNEGYNLYDIHTLDQRSDSEEIKLSNYSLHITPERILSNLVQTNLVFGLSATADIPRCLHHFDLEWLAHQPGVNVIGLDEQDRTLIGELNELKKAARATELEVVRLSELESADPVQQHLKRLIEIAGEDEDFGEGVDSKEGHRKLRVERFFATLLWTIQQPQEVAGLSHLMFLNSFRQIKLVLDRYAHLGGEFLEVTKQVGNEWFEVYTLTLLERSFTVVFYDAERAKHIRRQEQAQQAFDTLFQQDQPVVVVTQYLSAGNGVNMQFSPVANSTTRSDFLNLHLLEVPYFYFSNPAKEESPEKRIAALKENIWYQAKLFTSKYISQARFQWALSTLHHCEDWNSRYQREFTTRSDALLNNVATLIQALGRIEREWSATPRQTVVMSNEAYSTFQAFLGEDFDPIRESRQNIISGNLSQLLAKVAEETSRASREVRRKKDSRLAEVDNKCHTKIKELVDRLNKVRRGEDLTARQEWQQLRQAVLRHDFGDELVTKYSCAFESNYLKDGILWTNEAKEIIPAHLGREGIDLKWYLNSVYGQVGSNKIISDYFLWRGYELAFNATSKKFFTPYCYQAILTGAIGEEALTALLQYEKFELEEVSDLLFEVCDTKLKNVPYYIDFKNYTDTTLGRFTLSEDDPFYHPTLNETHFKERARQKLARLIEVEGENAKLIYLNLTTSQERPLGYYDHKFNPVPDFPQAQIVVVQGCLVRQQPALYHQSFRHFLVDLQAALAKDTEV